MKRTSARKNEDRSITVDFQTKAKYHALCTDGKVFVEFVVAFIASLGFQLLHKCGCPGGCALTRHSHYVRIRSGNLLIWRLQCKHCGAVFTILPHFVLRYRAMPPETAKQVLLATHGGLSLEWTATVIETLSPLAVYRLLCAYGRTGVVPVLVRCGLPLPAYLLADEKHSHCLADKVYLPTIVVGRVIWHLGYCTDKSADAFQAAYRLFQQALLRIQPTYSPLGILTDGFESTRKSLHALFPAAKLGNCLWHAMRRVGHKLRGVSSATRDLLRGNFFGMFQDRQSRQRLTLCSLAQKLHHFAKQVTKLAGEKNGACLREWIQKKKAGWYVLFRHRQMPATSTLLDQAHNALDRKLFMMKGFHHPDGHQQIFLNGVALLYNFVPYQRRAKHAGQCGVEVEGGKLPTNDWFLNLRIVTSGGFQ
jgi:hypothetical protein